MSHLGTPDGWCRPTTRCGLRGTRHGLLAKPLGLPLHPLGLPLPSWCLIPGLCWNRSSLALCCPHVAVLRRAEAARGRPGSTQEPLQTGNPFHRPEPSAPQNPPQRPHQMFSTNSAIWKLSKCLRPPALSMSYILGRGRPGRSCSPPLSRCSRLPSLLSPLPTPSLPAGRKEAAHSARVGYFQLTLNSPGLGYKESGTSAQSPLPSPPRPPCTHPRPKAFPSQHSPPRSRRPPPSPTQHSGLRGKAGARFAASSALWRGQGAQGTALPQGGVLTHRRLSPYPWGLGRPSPRQEHSHCQGQGGSVPNQIISKARSASDLMI